VQPGTTAMAENPPFELRCQSGCSVP